VEQRVADYQTSLLKDKELRLQLVFNLLHQWLRRLVRRVLQGLLQEGHQIKLGTTLDLA